MKGANSFAAYHGTKGPVHVSFPNTMYGGLQQPAFVNSVQNLTNIALSADLNGGNPNCVSYVPNVCLQFFACGSKALIEQIHLVDQ